jgi:hypothetical protein
MLYKMFAETAVRDGFVIRHADLLPEHLAQVY